MRQSTGWLEGSKYPGPHVSQETFVTCFTSPLCSCTTTGELLPKTDPASYPAMLAAASNQIHLQRKVLRALEYKRR